MGSKISNRKNNSGSVEDFIPALLSIQSTIIKNQLNQNIAISKIMAKLSTIEKNTSKK